MKGKHIAWGIGIGLVLTVTSYMIIRAKKKKKDSKKENLPPDNQEKQQAKLESAYSPEKKRDIAKPKIPIGDAFPLRLGSKGKKVERLNIWLMRNVGWTGKITDEFTEDTQNKLMKHLKIKQLDKQRYLKLGMNKPIYEQEISY